MADVVEQTSGYGHGYFSFSCAASVVYNVADCLLFLFPSYLSLYASDVMFILSIGSIVWGSTNVRSHGSFLSAVGSIA